MGGDITQEMIRRRAEHNDCILYTLEVKHLLLTIYHCEYKKSMVYGRSRPDRFHGKGRKSVYHHSTIW